uniref:Uncharacterized protein n=1 Tax=Fagus sylvatica TaxID=28930 RepID=A0A2N9IHS5_FAGSY
MEFLTASFQVIFEKIIDFTIGVVGRQIRYPIDYKKNTDNLGTQVKEIEDARDDVERRVEVARRNVEQIEGKVRRWLTDVEEITAKARYKLSKRAYKLGLEVKEIMGKGNFSTVGYRVPIGGIGIEISTKGYEHFESRRSIFEGVMKALKDDNIRAIGVYGMGGTGCKILLTSRSKDVLVKDMDAQEIFPVGVLLDNEATYLFRKIVGDLVETLDFQSIVVEVIEECGGLPIALTAVAHALKSEKAQNVWKDALRQLRMANPIDIEGMHEKVYPSIKLSYNVLSKEAQSLFLFCSTFQEDVDIPIEFLWRLLVGLDFFEDVFTMEEVRNKGVYIDEDFPKLKYLEIKENAELQYIISWTGVPRVAFPLLESISLNTCQIGKDATANLLRGFVDCIPDEDFPKLKYLKIKENAELQYIISWTGVQRLILFSSSVVGSFPLCTGMSAIVAKESEEEIEIDSDQYNVSSTYDQIGKDMPRPTC